MVVSGEEPLKQDVTLLIRGKALTGQVIEIRQDTTVSTGSTELVRLRVGDLGEGR